MLEAPSTPMIQEAKIGEYPWSVSMGTPCEDTRLIEKPQVKKDPASCQKATVRRSAEVDVRWMDAGTVVPAGAAAPSGASPMPSGESRTTKRQSGSIPTRTKTPIRA